MRVAFPPLPMEPSPQVTSGDGISRSGVAPGTPGAWATPPTAPSPSELAIKGGFTVVDRQQRRLHDCAHTLGFADLDGYLVARCQQQASLAQLAGQLGTTTPVVRRLLDHAGLAPSPQPVLSAAGRRRGTEQRLARRAAQLGFPTLHAYLTDRLVGQAWPLAQVTSELGTHHKTLRRLLDHHQLRRARQAGPTRLAGARGRQAQARGWQAKRQLRLAELGFGDLAGYLHARVVEEGWSVRRVRAELRVGGVWPVEQLAKLGLRS